MLISIATPKSKLQWGTATLLFVILVLLARAFFDTHGIYLVATLSALQLLPLWLCFVDRRIDFMTIIMTSTFVTMTMGQLALLVISDLNPLPKDSIISLRAQMICTCLMLATFISLRYRFRKHTTRIENFKLVELHWWQFPLPTLFILAMSLWETKLPASISHPLSVINGVAVVLVFAATCRKYPWVDYLCEAIAGISGYFVFALQTTLLSWVSIAIIWFIELVLRRRKLDFIRIAGLMVVMICFQSIKPYYRVEVEKNPALTLAQRTEVIGGLLRQKYFPSMSKNLKEPGSEVVLAGFPVPELIKKLFSAVSRVEDSSLEKVLVMTPEPVPYWKGKTYAAIPAMLIPRALWPNKPSFGFWHEFGQTYGYLNPDDHQTSVTYNYLAEAYMNFGYAFLLGVASLFGVLVASVERLSRWDLPDYSTFSFICFVVPFVNAADSASILLAIFSTALVLIPLRYPFGNLQKGWPVVKGSPAAS